MDRSLERKIKNVSSDVDSILSELSDEILDLERQLSEVTNERDKILEELDDLKKNLPKDIPGFEGTLDRLQDL